MTPVGEARMSGNTEDHHSTDAAPVLCVVDDDEGTVQLVREIASESGWVAYGFRRISEVRAFLDRRRPSLLVLDDDLPDGRGGDLARELLADPGMHDVQLVVCTAAHPARQAEIEGWVPVMSKPFDLGELESHLESNRSVHRQPQHASG
jgi:two-component system, OmpR family, phosphate regulon response regulator PhoB